MKRVLVVFSLTVAGLVASSASGQVVIQPNLFFQNPLLLVENKDVQKDLKLSDEQAEKIASLSRDHAATVKGLMFTVADQEKRKKANETALKGLAELLDAKQAKRLKQLELQQRGAGVFGDPAIAKQLEFTRQQQNSIITTLQGFQPKWIAIFQAAKGNQQEIQRKLADVHRDLSATIVKSLTKEQQEKWDELAGAPFKGAFPSMPPVIVDMRPQPTLAWHMNDLNAALAEAKKTGKPIFVTFRCEA
jgi:hypothetical protein